ncbi:hypothetical protein GCM10023329_33740 [Streptomyces sanyensis]|uniref:Uncharacterized protein n=1 Tax=Streptomyces sanyensis TaxID=568869 RepID=A0ABP9AKX2_9ACTN
MRLGRASAPAAESGAGPGSLADPRGAAGFGEDPGGPGGAEPRAAGRRRPPGFRGVAWTPMRPAPPARPGRTSQ